MTSIPAPPTPPMSGRARAIIYGVWAWLNVVVFLVSIGWAVFGNIPQQVFAVSVVLNGFGSVTGFLAKNNVHTVT